MNPFDLFHAWGDMRRSYVPSADECGEMARRKRLQDAAKRGNEHAKRILKTHYHLLTLQLGGQRVFGGGR